MAFQKAFKTKQGMDCPEFYLVVEEARWVKGRQTVCIVAGYKDNNARKNNAEPFLFLHYDFKYDISSPKNIIQQAYEQLKLEDFYKDALDV